MTRESLQYRTERDIVAKRQATAAVTGKPFKRLTFTEKLAIRRQVNNIVKD